MFLFCVRHLVAIIKTFRLLWFHIQATVDVIKRSSCKFVWQFRLCFLNGLNTLKYQNENKRCRRSNFLCIALVTDMSAWPTDSDNNPTDTPLQVVHNNKGTPRIGCSQLVHYNQMLGSKTACHAAIWHGEIRLDEIHFKVQRLAYRRIQSATYKYQARGGVLRHERWHTYRIILLSAFEGCLNVFWDLSSCRWEISIVLHNICRVSYCFAFIYSFCVDGCWYSVTVSQILHKIME